MRGNEGIGGRLLLTAGMASLSLLGAACSGLPGHAAAAGQAAVAEPRVQVRVTPGNSTRGVNPAQRVTVSSAYGTISAVAVVGGADPIPGSFNTTHTVWHSAGPLHPAWKYVVSVAAVGASGHTVTTTSTFNTATPRQVLQTQIFEGYQQSYGVGMPIILTFSHRITRKAAVERAMQIWTSKPITGAWYWDSSTSLVFRPRTYWPQNTRVRFTAHLNGLEVAPGVYGMSDLTQSFRIGRSLIAVVDTASHYAHIYYRNRLFGVWPVSTGAPGDDTADGTYLTIEKGNPVLMSGPGYTDFPVPYSVRFTWSGDYMHDAYWSVGEQGYSNVSHGCVNLSPEHAQIYYNLAVPGDPVTITHSPVAGAWDDGWTEWFLTWKQLLHGSATHEAVQAGPSGSSFVNPATLSPSTATAPLGNSRPGNSAAR